MENLNLGSGSSLLGGGNAALQDAIRRRQTGQAGQMQAQSPASAGFDPSIVSPTLPNPQSSPSAMISSGQPSAMATGAPSAQVSTGAPQQDLSSLIGFQTAPENDLIIKALSQKLRNNSQLEKMRGGM